MPMTAYERNKRYIARKKGLLPPPDPAMTPLERNRKYLYGLDRNGFNSLLELQNHRCAICGEEIGQVCQVDHEHGSGKIRGLLCFRCNLLLGYLENTPFCIIKKMYGYLDENK